MKFNGIHWNEDGIADSFAMKDRVTIRSAGTERIESI